MPMSNRYGGTPETMVYMPTFDPSLEDWVIATAASYFFEPWCTEYSPAEQGCFVVTFGESGTRHRGVEVEAHETGGVSVWVPEGGRVLVP
jgi:hypothetical protein